MKYKLVAFTVSLCLIFSLTGCRELVSTEYDEVEVVISDTHHKGAYTQIIMCGKTPVSI